MTLVKCNTFRQHRGERKCTLTRFSSIESVGNEQIPPSGDPRLGILFEYPLWIRTHSLTHNIYVYTVGITPGVVDFRLLATWGTVGFYRQPWAVIPYGVSIC